ncbi:Elongation factor P [Candidatus Hepatincolaceae symbiont of Richtersius coronifer]
MKANELRIGMIIKHNDRLFRVVKTEHVKPGKGGAYQQTELKDVLSGTKINERFRSEATIDRAILEQKDCVFSYEDKGFYIFTNQENYEEILLSKSDIGENKLLFLKEGMPVTIELYEEKAIDLELPATVVLEVIDTEAVIKGQTASSSFKPATLENGIRTTVPPHIGVNTKIVVNTADNSYVERTK